ncbi:MAG: TfoX/Sxy family protein [Chloroflexota bacterium]
MAYDEGLAQRVREVLDVRDDIGEKKMFGGLSFLLNGNMAVGVIGDELIVRVGPHDYEEALAREHARAFDFTGRTMSGWVVVETEGLEEDEDLTEWVLRGVGFAGTLPEK